MHKREKVKNDSLFCLNDDPDRHDWFTCVGSRLTSEGGSIRRLLFYAHRYWRGDRFDVEFGAAPESPHILNRIQLQLIEFGNAGQLRPFGPQPPPPFAPVRPAVPLH